MILQVLFMKSFGNVVKLITLVTTGLFILNMLVMSIFFNTNVLNPVKTIITSNGQEIVKNEQKASQYDNGAVNDTDLFEATSSESTSQSEEGEIYNVDGYAGEVNNKKLVQNDEGKAVDAASYYMTTAEIGSLEDMSLAEKLEAVTIISKVNKEAADDIYDMSIDGVTYEEKEKIQTVLGKYLTSEEIQRLMNIFSKN